MTSSFDPRVYLLFVLFSSLCGILASHPAPAAIALAMTILFCLSQEVNVRTLWKKGRFLWRTLLLVVLMQSIFAPSGQTLLAIGSVRLLTLGGLLAGVTILCRMATLLLGGVLLAEQGSQAIIRGLIKLKLPYELAYMVGLNLRFIPLIGAEFGDSLTAIQLRGLDLKRIPLGKRIKVYSFLLLPAIAAAVKRAEEIADAMETRGFRALSKRSSYWTMELSWQDKVVMVLIAVVGIFLSVLAVIWR